MKKRVIMTIVVLAAVLCVTGCKGKETKKSSPTTERIEENIAPDYHFEEKFSLQIGETVSLEKGITFQLVNVIYNDDGENGYHWITYKLTTKEEEFESSLSLYSDGKNEIVEEKYNPYIVNAIQVENDVVTFKVSDIPEKPKAMEVSGKKEDTYTTSEYEYIEGKKCMLYFDKGITFQGDILQMIENVMDEVEKETGYSFYPEESKYSVLHENGIREAYYGTDPWPGLDEWNEKRAVYFVNGKNFDEPVISSGIARAICLISYDLKEDMIYAIAHEFTHTICIANGENLNRKLSEGYACYIGRKVAAKFSGYPVTNNSKECGTGLFQEELNGNTAEKIFMKDYAVEENYKDYEYGTYLVTYMIETYGEGAFRKFLGNLNEKTRDDYMSPDNEMQKETLKETFSEEFFHDFGVWYQSNSSRFTED
jgi:hypothetical protein